MLYSGGELGYQSNVGRNVSKYHDFRARLENNSLLLKYTSFMLDSYYSKLKWLLVSSTSNLEMERVLILNVMERK